MKPSTHHPQPHRGKLPPILDLDDDDSGMNELPAWSRPRWSSDEEQQGVAMGEWPTEFDD